MQRESERVILACFGVGSLNFDYKEIDHAVDLYANFR